MSLLKIDELYAMLNRLAVYFSSDCSSGYHYVGLSPEAQNKSAFMLLIGKFEFKKVPLCLAWAPTHF